MPDGNYPTILFVQSFLEHPRGGIGQYESQMFHRLSQVKNIELYIPKIRAIKIPRIFHKFFFVNVKAFAENNPFWINIPKRRSVIVHLSHQFMGIAIPITKIRGLFSQSKPRIVITVHDLYDLETYQNPLLRNFQPNWRWADKLANKMMLMGIGFADHVIVDSYATKEFVVRVIPKMRKKISVIHLGWDGLDGEEPRRNLNRRKPRQILYVGSLHPRKNVLTLVNAISLLRRQAYDVNLILAGALRTSSVPREIISTDGVVVLGEVTSAQIQELYESSSVFAFPSLSEGFGLPLIEAMGFGCPVVASDIPIFREIAGDAAVYVSPLDTEAWATAIRTLLDDEYSRATLSQKGINIAKQYSWDTAFQETLAVYDKVTGQSHENSLNNSIIKYR